MIDIVRGKAVRLGLALITSAAAVAGLMLGSAGASHLPRSTSLPCRAGGAACLGIGFTDAWFNGTTVQLGYSHPFFCAAPPTSGAASGCEAGKVATTPPPSGPVVSNIYLLIPLGFNPPGATVQCGSRCIDQPRRMDLPRVFGKDLSNGIVGPRSFVIEDPEAFQSTWWPVVLVGVKNLQAWNTIAAAKTIDSVDACQASGGCATEVDTNAFLYFQVLGPGMSPQGPA